MSFITSIAPALPDRQATSDDISTAAYQRYAIYFLISLGIGFRLFHFIYNRSLFIDELYLDINLIKMSFRELATLPFEYEQKAPIGYLWAVKLCVVLFGKGEKALRLFSLLCGISSLFLFVPVARYYLKGWSVVVAVGILSLSWAVIYHSVEAKQYITELLTTVLALLLYTKYNRSTTLRPLLLWGIFGGLLLWFSFSLVFVLAGIGSAVCLDIALRKEWKRFFTYLIPFSLWAVSFGLLYLLFLGKYHQSGWLIDFFDKVYVAFMPLKPTSLTDAIWFVQTPYSILHYPFGLLVNLDGSGITNPILKFILKLGWIPAVVICYGMVMLFLKSRVNFFVLSLPLLFVLLASGLRLYPIYARFVLFLVPLIVLFLAFGFEKVSEAFKDNKTVTGALLLVMLAPPLFNSVRQVIDPRIMSGATERELLLSVNNQYKEGDAVYVFWNMRHAYGYYKEAYNLKYTATQASYVKNISASPEEYLNNLKPDFENFKGKKRLWFIYDPNNVNHIGEYVGQPLWYHDKNFHAEQLLEREFDKLGKRISHYRNKRNSLSYTLYELNQ
jgi:hypothetical protein